MTYNFPELSLNKWQASRDSIQYITKLMSQIRGQLSSPEKHYFHLSLRSHALGLTTGPIPLSDSDLASVEIALDFTRALIYIDYSDGNHDEYSFLEKSAESISTFFQKHFPSVSLNEIAPVQMNLKQSDLLDYWKAISKIDQILKQFKATLNEETGSVQLWPDHFDLALLYFSGRFIRGIDPTDIDNAKEQMNFGFSTGDSSINEAYFYITSYPKHPKLTTLPLSKKAYWHSDAFTAAILRYNDMRRMEANCDVLFNFFLENFTRIRTLNEQSSI